MRCRQLLASRWLSVQVRCGAVYRRSVRSSCFFFCIAINQLVCQWPVCQSRRLTRTCDGWCSSVGFALRLSNKQVFVFIIYGLIHIHMLYYDKNCNNTKSFFQQSRQATQSASDAWCEEKWLDWWHLVRQLELSIVLFSFSSFVVVLNAVFFFDRLKNEWELKRNNDVEKKI